ncbi:hypothetical protein PFISCL1PPCAC_22064, partial [Pristionchus fissidentatus]
GQNLMSISYSRSLTPSTILVTVQLNGTYSEENFDPVFGIEQVHGESQFKCSSNGITGDAKFTIAKHGTRQIFNKNLIFCSFKLSSSQEKLVKNFAEPKYNVFPKLLYRLSDANEKSILLLKRGTFFWTLPEPQCDQSLIKTNDGVLRDFLLSSVDATKSAIFCDSPAKLLLVDGSEKFIDEMRCIDKQFNYTGGEGGVVAANKTFELYCSEEFSSLCSPITTRWQTG